MSQPTTLARLERLLVVVPWLVAHPGTPVEEVCARFGVDREALLADLDVLGYCGVPGYGGGDLVQVHLVDDAITVRLADALERPLRPTAEEAAALLLAVRTAQRLPGVADLEALEGAAAALERVLGSEAGAVTVSVEAPDATTVGVVREALEGGVPLGLDYLDAASQRSDRVVEPWRVTVAEGVWYLQAHCRRAGAPRDFRLDRIVAAQALADDPHGVRAAPDPLPAPGFDPPPGDEELVLLVDPADAWVAEQLPGARSARRGHALEIRAPLGRQAWAVRFVASLGGRARVEAPTSVARAVVERAQEALAAHDAWHGREGGPERSRATGDG